jgi:deoxyribonuclease IV
VGVHCSVRRGYGAALEEAHRMGCETLQIFSRPPRSTDPVDPAEAEAFRRRRAELALFPLVIHTPFLPNLCTRHPRVYARSRRALSDDLAACEALGADFLVIHPGAYSEGATPEDGLARMAEAVNVALASPGKTRLLIENVAGGRRRLGSSWEELTRFLAQVHYPDRIGLCLDTAHLHGAGYPFTNEREVLNTLAQLQQRIGLAQVFVIHANDSEADLGSHLDLHAHIGEGRLGLEPFRTLLRHPALQHCAAIAEP